MDSIRHWLGRRHPCACGREHAIRTRHVVLADDGPTALWPFLHAGDGSSNVIMVGDVHTGPIAANAASCLRAHGVAVRRIVVHGPGGGALVPDEQALRHVSHALAGTDATTTVLSVGSGTITDLGKAAATEHQRRFIAYPTAASMNGYTSTIAALQRGGLKVTPAVDPPEVVVVDRHAVGSAPPILGAAGFADLLSKFVCHGDWLVAHHVVGEYHCRVPTELAAQAVDAAVRMADDIGRADPAAVNALCAALLLSGISMAAAGSSSPASGGEHLISHYWDMTRPGTGGRRYHGTQVGIGTLITATLYEQLLSMSPADVKPRERPALPGEDPSLEEEIAGHFGPLAAPVIAQARAKQVTPDEAACRANAIAKNWSRLRDILAPLLKPPHEIRDLLRRAGAPTTLTELGLGTDDALEALRWARFIRARYTVLDLAADVGLLTTDAERLALLRRSGVVNGLA